MDKDIEKYDKEKEEFFKELETMRPDLIYSEGWTTAQKNQASDMLRPARTKANMLSAIPLLCAGSECVFAPSCPLLKEGLAPIGKSCPIESAAAMQFFSDYVEELGVDTSRMIEVSLVRDLVDQEIQQMRKTWILSQEHFIQENVAGITADGEVVTKKELHQAVAYEDKIHKRKEKLRNALLATREAKAKAGKGEVDSAAVIANILQDVRKVENAREKALMKELGYGDQYIEDAEIVDGEIEENESE